MANEVTATCSLAYKDSQGVDVAGPDLGDVLASVATKKYMKFVQNIGTTEEAVILGEVTAPGWAFFVNRDVTNFIELRVASSGAKFAKLLPGEFACLRLGSGAQAPYAIADTSACNMETFLIDT